MYDLNAFDVTQLTSYLGVIRNKVSTLLRVIMRKQTSEVRNDMDLLYVSLFRTSQFVIFMNHFHCWNGERDVVG